MSNAEVIIADLSHDGRGVARDRGKVKLIAGALPNETVTYRVLKTHRSHDDARVETVLLPSPQRTAPPCSHFGRCGGCVLQHLQADQQIHHKQQWLSDNFMRISHLEPLRWLPPLNGPAWGYRHKARLGAKWVAKKNKLVVGFREVDGRFVADLQECPVLHPSVGERLPALAEALGQLSIRDQLPQIEVAIADVGPPTLNLRVLADPTAADLQLLIALAQQEQWQLYLQRGGLNTIAPLYPNPPAPLFYELPDFGLQMAFSPWQFTQVNFAINRLMIRQAIDLLELSPDDQVLDLFCGLGNFSLPLARTARQVIGVEGEISLVNQATFNADRHGVQNAAFFAADLTKAVATTDWFRRPWNKVLIDPPRSGAFDLMAPIAARQPDCVVYVSCHPATLARDAVELARCGYRLDASGVMDMFPHTAHVESMALFRRA